MGYCYKSSTQAQEEPMADHGIVLEKLLQRIAESGNSEKLNGMATALEHALGDDCSQKLIAILKELLED